MYKNLFQFKRLRSPIWIGVFVLIIIITVFTFASLILYNYTVNLLTENLRERLLSISITVAANINSRDLEALQVEEDWKKPEWGRIVNRLHNAKYSNKDIVFMYIFRQKKDNPTEMEFVADADSINPYANTSEDPSMFVDVNRDGKIEPDGPDKLQWPGQDYPEAVDIPEAFEAYKGALTNKDLYTDEYGTVLTGYAPIKDEYGNTVAVLATDIKANDFFTITRQTLYPFLMFIFFLVLVIVIFNILLIRSIKKEVKQKEQIEVLNKELARAFAIEKKANDELEKLDEYKNDFLRQTQHDLRKPLGIIKDYCDLLLQGMFGKIPKTAAVKIENMQTVAQEKIKDINNFLNTAKMKSEGLEGVVSLVPGVEVLPMLEEIVNVLKGEAEKNKIYLKLEKSRQKFFIKADREKLKSVLFNVVDNAVKYTKKGGVDIKLEDEESKVRIIVADTGIGISEEEMKTIFTAQFKRSKEAESMAKGSGVGLSNTADMIKLHNGIIRAVSPGKGKGSTFYIELPINGGTKVL